MKSVLCAVTGPGGVLTAARAHTLSEKLEYSSVSDISMLFHEHNITNILEKYSPLYVLMFFQNYFGFFRSSTFRDI
jgi:hypothetical protein